MPATWLRWGTDANGDGIADPWNPDDAIFSAARYLAAAGGATDLYRGVFAYNHADWYVKEVPRSRRTSTARAAAWSPSRSTGCRCRLDAARSDVVARARASSPRRRLCARSAAMLASTQARAARHRSSPTGSTSRRGAGRPRGRDAAAAVVASARSARRCAGRARPRAAAVRAASPSIPAAGQLFGVAVVLSPATSSRSAAAPASSPPRTPTTTIPAADIAAPMGSPLYALAELRRAPLVEHAGPRAAASASRCRPSTARPGRTATLVPRPERRPGRRAHRRAAGRPRRRDRPRDRPAPPSPAPARDRLAAAGGVVPVLRRHGLHWSDTGANDGSSAGRPRSRPRWRRSLAIAGSRSRSRSGPAGGGRSSRSFRPRRRRRRRRSRLLQLAS